MALARTTPIVLNLIIINVLCFMAQSLLGGPGDSDMITNLFALHHIHSDYFRPWQVITHMFMHGNFMHLFR